MIAEYVFDIILILVSGCACIYCWQLNKRLRALQDMKKGLGASIMTLSAAINKTGAAAQEAKLSAAESVEHLRKLLSDAEENIPKLDMMLDNLERSSRRARKDSQAIQEQVATTLEPLLQEAQDKAGNLSVVLTQLDQYSKKLMTHAANEASQPRTAQQPEPTAISGQATRRQQ